MRFFGILEFFLRLFHERNSRYDFAFVIFETECLDFFLAEMRRRTNGVSGGNFDCAQSLSAHVFDVAFFLVFSFKNSV